MLIQQGLLDFVLSDCSQLSPQSSRGVPYLVYYTRTRLEELDTESSSVLKWDQLIVFKPMLWVLENKILKILWPVCMVFTWFLKSCTCLKDIDVDVSIIVIKCVFYISYSANIFLNEFLEFLEWDICNYNLLAHVANITTNRTFKCWCIIVDFMEITQFQVFWNCFWSWCRSAA